MKDILRDSVLGQFLNYISGGRMLPYSDQREDFVIPDHFQTNFISRSASHATTVGDTTPSDLKKIPSIDRSLSNLPLPTIPVYLQSALTSSVASTRTVVRDNAISATTNAVVDNTEGRFSKGPNSNLEEGNAFCEKVRDELANAQLHPDQVKEQPSNLVGWYGPQDQDNPRNWSLYKRSFVAFSISLLTFSVYVGSAIYTSSIPSLMAEFGISQTRATLGLTLYVLAYGIGPMFLAPLQDMAHIGRNPVYIGGLAAFLLFNTAIVEAKNSSTVLVFRFLTGFVGSPALATGGASMGDIFPPQAQPYVMGIWALGAVAGPILGPVIGGFAAQANGWKWPIYELMWISGFALIFLAILLPETLAANILLKRARRLRKLTGNSELRSQSEIDQAAISKKDFVYESLVQPFILAAEPALLFANVFIGLFEAFPLVFNDIYHFNLGVGSLPFVAFVISGSFTYTFYVLYNRYHMEPRIARNPNLAPEARLEIGLMASIFIPISLFIFGWASRASVHWIVPVTAAALYQPGIFLTFQSIMMYISMSYPNHVASVLAGNDLFRSSMASAFPLFGRIFFERLGLGGGSSLLAGISIALIPVYFLLVKYGHCLREKSRYAHYEA
ncbi:MFS general substrate transporter [Athelia psychrophila]|uniref:MFS general substrate transporter n=1 Tax=Athelia psychrophila TaxID=1759441 RepID=A0A167VB59_9AGAM|nr:MFS general substrate transporter [Fibularhizoctonia sp. CBS 109695]